jgi:hypothetical protein
MARVSHSSPVERYRAEAAYALSRIRHYQARGDTCQVEQWHRIWSLARTAIDAELREKGGGARVVRLKNAPPLRPLPEELSSVSLPPVPDSITTSEVATVPDQDPGTAAPADPLKIALARHSLIERALRAGGANPLPGELDEARWQYHLTAFREGGPYDCDLLQQAEAAVEALVEMLPEYREPDSFDIEPGQELSGEEQDPSPASFETTALPECVRIYRESLLELTEDELCADLETCQDAGRRDTAALIETELQRRERETAPDLTAIFARTAASAVPSSSALTGPSNAGDRVAEPPRSGGSSLERTPPRQRPEYGSPRGASAPRMPKKHSPGPAEMKSQTPETGYTTAPAWIDATGRTRTWNLFDPSGEKMAEIATRRDAEKLAAIFNQLLGGQSVPPVEEP